MTQSPRSLLLHEVLPSDALAASFAATRRAARRRRLRQHTVRATTVVAVVAIITWRALLPSPSAPETSPVAEAPAVDPRPPTRPPAHLSISTRAEWAPLRVTTQPRTSLLLATTRSTPVVSTRTASVPLPRLSEADLFAAAGPRPAAIHQQPDGSRRWMWLDRRPNTP